MLSLIIKLRVTILRHTLRLRFSWYMKLSENTQVDYQNLVCESTWIVSVHRHSRLSVEVGLILVSDMYDVGLFPRTPDPV